MNTIVKATSKGQITLPVKWRKNFDTNQYLVKPQGDALIITALQVESIEDENWETVFDADRDNAGKGISIDKFIQVLKKTL